MPFSFKFEKRTELSRKAGLVFSRIEEEKDAKSDNVTAGRLVAAFGEYLENTLRSTNKAQSGLLLILDSGEQITIKDAKPGSDYRGMSIEPELPWDQKKHLSNDKVQIIVCPLSFDKVQTIIFYEKEFGDFCDVNMVTVYEYAEKLRLIGILPQGEKRLLEKCSDDPSKLRDFTIEHSNIADETGACPRNPKTWVSTQFDLRLFSPKTNMTHENPIPAEQSASVRVESKLTI